MPDEVVTQEERAPLTANIPIEQYYKDNGNIPYSSKFFDMGDSFDYLPSDVQEKLHDIDKFVEQEVAQRGWKFNVEAYERTLENIALELGGNEGSLNEQLERLAGFARNVLKLQGIDDIKKTLRREITKYRRQKDMDRAVMAAIGKKIV